MEHIHMCVCDVVKFIIFDTVLSITAPHLPCIHRLSFTSFQPPPLAFDDSVSQAGPVWHAIQFCMPPHFSPDSHSRSEDLSAQLHLENLDAVTSFSLIRDPYFSLTWSTSPESLRWTVQILCSYSDWEHHTTVANSTLQADSHGGITILLVNPITDPYLCLSGLSKTITSIFYMTGSTLTIYLTKDC